MLRTDFPTDLRHDGTVQAHLQQRIQASVQLGRTMHEAESQPTSPGDPSLDRLKELERELHLLKAKVRMYERTAFGGAGLAGFIAFGPNLTLAIARWEKAFINSSHRPFWRRIPRKETIDVAGAYLRRRAHVGLMTAAMVTLPGMITVYLLYQQNAKIDRQIYLASAAGLNDLQSVVVETLKDLQDEPARLCVSNAAIAVSKESNLKPTERYNVVRRNRCWDSIRRFADFMTRDDWIRSFENNVESSFSPVKRLLKDRGPRVYVDPGVAADQVGDRLYFNVEPSAQLLIRATTLSEALKPYRQLVDNDASSDQPALEAEPFSPERGQLMRAFAANQLMPRRLNFSRAWAPGAELQRVDWRDTELIGAVVECSDLSMGRFDGARLARLRAAGASFSQSDLRNVESLRGADFSNARFHSTIMPTAEVSKEARWKGANFQGALVPSEDWLNRVHGDSALSYRLSATTLQVEGRPYWKVELSGDKSPLAPQPREQYAGRGDMPIEFCKSRREASYSRLSP